MPFLESSAYNYVSSSSSSSSMTFSFVSRVIPKPVRVIFNNPATVVYWDDGTKTVVKCSENEPFIEEVGLAMAFMRKLYPNRSEFLKWVENAYRQEKTEKKKSEPEPEPILEIKDDGESFDGGGIA